MHIRNLILRLSPVSRRLFVAIECMRFFWVLFMCVPVCMAKVRRKQQALCCAKEMIRKQNSLPLFRCVAGCIRRSVVDITFIQRQAPDSTRTSSRVQLLADCCVRQTRAVYWRSRSHVRASNRSHEVDYISAQASFNEQQKKFSLLCDESISRAASNRKMGFWLEKFEMVQVNCGLRIDTKVKFRKFQETFLSLLQFEANLTNHQSSRQTLSNKSLKNKN